MVKIGPYFHKFMWVVIFVFFKKKIVPKEFFLKVLLGALFITILWVVLLGLPN